MMASSPQLFLALNDPSRARWDCGCDEAFRAREQKGWEDSFLGELPIR
jgi:hypothetical protein